MPADDWRLSGKTRTIESKYQVFVVKLYFRPSKQTRLNGNRMATNSTMISIQDLNEETHLRLKNDHA